MASERRQIVIVGSGFAGTILARALARQGRDVLVLERGSHPRFALGESSTPLAAIALERLARRYDLPDLAHLAAWGRWRRELPALRRGLKRGFTFWWHRESERWQPGTDNLRRLLVAASPDDEIADVHWMRSDVDHHLVQRARSEGVEIREHTSVTAATEVDDGLELRGERDGQPFALHASIVIDASGPGGFLARAFELPPRTPQPWSPPAAGALVGHFDGVRPLAEVAADHRVDLEPGPYPDEWAAVHHLLDGGWVYALRFDDARGDCTGRVSAGAILSLEGPLADLAQLAGSDPAAAWQTLLQRYPTLAAQFAAAEPARPITWSPRLRHRLERAGGRRWALLPHSFVFFDPLFSTGIAWSLLAVERLAELLGSSRTADLTRYSALLADEADHVERLIGCAWHTLSNPRALTATGFLYFAAASWSEIRQRLLPDREPWHWQGFLGATDARISEWLTDAAGRAGGPPDSYLRWVTRTIEPCNLVGLAEPRRRNLYPVDLQNLVDAAGRLGLTTGELQTRLPQLRGD